MDNDNSDYDDGGGGDDDDDDSGDNDDNSEEVQISDILCITKSGRTRTTFKGWYLSYWFSNKVDIWL